MHPVFGRSYGSIWMVMQDLLVLSAMTTAKLDSLRRCSSPLSLDGKFSVVGTSSSVGIVSRPRALGIRTVSSPTTRFISLFPWRG